MEPPHSRIRSRDRFLGIKSTLFKLGIYILSIGMIFAVMKVLPISRREESTSFTVRKPLSFTLLDDKCDASFDKSGGIALYIVVVLYIFIGLAVICEHDFKDTLTIIASRLKLSEDVAGATFMAAGTSSPELFMSLVALLGPRDDIGVGTIIGSAIFNILVIIGASVLLSPHAFEIDYLVIIRDSFANIISFFYFLIVFLDAKIYWYEALTGVLLYIAYIVMMKHNDVILEYLEKFVTKFMLYLTCGFWHMTRQKQKAHERVIIDEHNDTSKVKMSTELTDMEALRVQHDIEDNNNNSDDLVSLETHVRLTIGEESAASSESSSAPDLHEVESPPDTLFGKIRYYVAWPWVFMFKWTIPKPGGSKSEYMFVVSFVVCLLWLAVLTWLMTMLTTKIGCILNISQAIVGITLLAIGTSCPDMLTSIAVARAGRGNMAISNALVQILCCSYSLVFGFV